MNERSDENESENGAGNPYAEAAGRVRGPLAACSPRRAAAACRLLIEAYAGDPGHVDWSDVQGALDAAMGAFGLSVGEGGALAAAGPEGDGGEPLPTAGPHWWRGGWYFRDESGENEIGPYGSCEEALVAMAAYGLALGRGPAFRWSDMLAVLRSAEESSRNFWREGGSGA